MTDRYLFIGGPLDMQSEFASGEPYVNVALPPPFSMSPAPTYDCDMAVYQVRKIQIFGNMRKVYVLQVLTEDEFTAKLGALCAILFDTYVQNV